VVIGNKTYFVDFAQVPKTDALAKCAEVEMQLVGFEEQQEYADLTDWLGNNGIKLQIIFIE